MDLEELLRVYEERLEYRRAQGVPEYEQYAIETSLNFYRKVANSKKEGKPLAWITLNFSNRPN